MSYLLTDKLLWRAAIKYRDWLKKIHAHSEQIKMTETYIGYINSCTNELGKWNRRFVIGNTPRTQKSNWDKNEHTGICNPKVYESIAKCMVPDLSERLINHVQCLKRLFEKTIDETISIPTVNDVIAELQAMRECWTVEYRNGTISVITESITLSDGEEEVDLGRFRIVLDLGDPVNGLTIESCDEIASEGGYYHPHVSQRMLCSGDGELLMLDALTQGRLEDYFRIAEAILSTYNGDSPYEELRQWYNPNHEGQFYCDYCNEWRDDDEIVSCIYCDTIFCESCASGGMCVECGDWFCSECVIACGVCGKSVCHECKCLCSKCEKHSCGDCIESCSTCGDSICNDCTTTCDCCEDKICKDCVNDSCCQCDGNICKGCQQTCDECDQTICDTCYENVCEHCGDHMCNSCKQDHECVLDEAKV